MHRSRNNNVSSITTPAAQISCFKTWICDKVAGGEGFRRLPERECGGNTGDGQKDDHDNKIETALRMRHDSSPCDDTLNSNGREAASYEASAMGF